MSDVDKLMVLLTQLSLLFAALSLIVAFATFAFVLIAELRFRRRFTPVAWWLEHLRSDDDDTGEECNHVYWLMNLGVDTATNVSVEATCGLQSSGVGLSLIQSGQKHEFTIRSTDFDNDWFIVSWAEATDRRFLYYQWFPLNQSGHLNDEWHQQWKAQAWKRWRPGLSTRKTKMVGPGAGVFMTRARTGRRDDTFQEFEKARALLETTRDQQIPGYLEAKKRSGA